MNLLGLEVKKINYCPKDKKKEKNLNDIFDENIQEKISTKGSKNNSRRIRKTIDCEKMDDFTINKMGFSHR